MSNKIINEYYRNICRTSSENTLAIEKKVLEMKLNNSYNYFEEKVIVIFTIIAMVFILLASSLAINNFNYIDTNSFIISVSAMTLLYLFFMVVFILVIANCNKNVNKSHM